MPALAHQTTVSSSFDEPVIGAQQTFRALLNAMARPGTIVPIHPHLDPPDPLYSSSAAICLTLFDLDTPVWTDLPEESNGCLWCQFHCGNPITHYPNKAVFGLITDSSKLPAVADFNAGTDERPETSATLVIQVKGFGSGRTLTLSGPGIQNTTRLKIKGLPEQFWNEYKRQCRQFPVGLDMIFTCEDYVAALPRTTKVH